jgi:hypothetical protein
LNGGRKKSEIKAFDYLGRNNQRASWRSSRCRLVEFRRGNVPASDCFPNMLVFGAFTIAVIEILPKERNGVGKS